MPNYTLPLVVIKSQYSSVQQSAYLYVPKGTVEINVIIVKKSEGYFSVIISFFEDVPLVEFMYLLSAHMPCESYCRRLGSLLLYLCYVFRALINSHDC